jgi:hypothetical protein
VPLGSPTMVLEVDRCASDRRRPCGDDGVMAVLVTAAPGSGADGTRGARAARGPDGLDLGPI